MTSRPSPGDEGLADPMAAIARWPELHRLTERCSAASAGGAVADARLGPPVPAPRQVFGIGLNYRDHAGETGMDLPPAPLTFTKFPSCITGPTAEVPLSGASVDWEVEIVAVIGAECTSVAPADAWGSVAGLTLGQDISDREVQMTGYAGPVLPGEELQRVRADRSRARLGGQPSPIRTTSRSGATWPASGCRRRGAACSSSRSRDWSPTCPRSARLYPGDLIFTGTPSGVGMARGRFLRTGEVIVSGAEGHRRAAQRLRRGTWPPRRPAGARGRRHGAPSQLTLPSSRSHAVVIPKPSSRLIGS